MDLVNDLRWKEAWYDPKYYLPSVAGVGYWGCPRIHSSSKSYKVWAAMLNRCFGVSTQKYAPSYQGVEVCEEWLNYSAFKKWFDKHWYDIGTERMELDHNIAI